MRSDLTDIILVVDRSDSMASVRDDAEGGNKWRECGNSWLVTRR